MKVKTFLSNYPFKNQIKGYIRPMDKPDSFCGFKKGKAHNQCPYLEDEIIKIDMDIITLSPTIWIKNYKKHLTNAP